MTGEKKRVLFYFVFWKLKIYAARADRERMDQPAEQWPITDPRKRWMICDHENSVLTRGIAIYLFMSVHE